MDAQEQRRLLELAAKAAGIGPVLCYESASNCLRIGDRKSYTLWRPLADDGDALRLAVKCNLNVCVGYASVSACLQDDGSFHKTVEIKNDPCAATRLAIVRAAAAIGEKMEKSK